MMSKRDEPDRSNPEDHLADFEKRLSAKLEARRVEDHKYDRPQQGWATGLRYGTEFMVGVLVGALIGYLIDVLFNTLPFGLLIGTFLGFGAGTVNVVRAAKELSERASREN
ncbi:AtpZ/AtpI family protein [Hyphobacterium sp.]|jgi:ATP synthase protein I|uniref:AtpZ/AtpI family protein n=1 Tax=Hyphobacterium sp. TaxID=2004662 RepID=UPI0037484C9C